MRRACLVILAAAVAGCGGKTPERTVEPPRVVRDTIPPKVVAESPPPEQIEDVNAPQEPGLLDNSQVVRIALAAGVSRVTISATGEWKLYDTNGESTLLHGDGGEQWIIEAERGGLRASRLDGSPTGVRPAPFIARSIARGSYLLVNGKKYRGEISVIPAPGGLSVINRLYMEDYLRGVVPLEIGQHRTEDERAAVEAQAVAARSYAYTHLVSEHERPYDMLATVLDQVYGGADAEGPLSDRAVFGTTRIVLTYNGRIINAPYHSTCGGSTAAASEVWKEGDEPYLVAVSDRIPGTADRYYCDPSPLFRWTRSYDQSSLRATLEKYLRNYAAVSSGGIGTVSSVEVESRTPSGRVRMLGIGTSRGHFSLRANDIRFVLRSPGGEILNSTYFSTESRQTPGGELTSLSIQGHGNGHGVGMCQWGAIGRARAGQDYRTILRTYYPGTTVASVSR
ncbi:MAG: SpoIID/LytB domain-containing protein [Gemmatimonadaceae bacterium]